MKTEKKTKQTKAAKRKEFVVFGLGRFGASVAKTLSDNGCQVLAVDTDAGKVALIADDVTQAVCMDVTDAEAMQSLGISNFDGAIVAIGENLEASVMVTILSKELGIPYVLAKAQTNLQAKVLKKVGADLIVFPEQETGIRIAHNLMEDNLMNAIELSTKHSMLELTVPEGWVGKSLRELNLRASKKINVIGIKKNDVLEITPDADEPLTSDDILIIIGKNQDISKLTGGKA